MYLFVLGRQPEIGLAELNAVFGNTGSILPHTALVKSDETPNINRLGGTRKIGRVIYDNDGKPGDFLNDKLSKLPAGKITLGISHYGKSASATNARKTGVILKKRLNRSVRVLPNSASEISDAASLGNKLGTTPNKIELMMVYIGHRLIIAELIGVQDLNSYTLRDRGRPRRDARVGMLPPKLAQIMINLAIGANATGATNHPTIQPSNQLTILDPFCGTGVVLQEAILMGYSVYGTDIDSRMVAYSKANLEWLLRQKNLVTNHLTIKPSNYITAVADATAHKWTSPIDCVVSETYLGQPYSAEPPIDKLRENMNTCNLIIEKFLSNIATQLKTGTPLCLAVPVWFVANKTYHLPVIKKLNELGFDLKLTPSNSRLVYRRDDQIVGRELLVLKRKTF